MTHHDSAIRTATEDLAEQVRRILETADAAVIAKAATVLNDVRLAFELETEFELEPIAIDWEMDEQA